jgi:glycosyltransferase involved in cell wall biosynthesis
MSIMKAWMAADGQPIYYIPNGISITPYENLPSRDEARARLGLPARSFVVGIVARVSPAKGHLLLIDVFTRVLRTFPGALLLIVGDGIRLPEVKARIQELGLGESVLVMGERRDVPVILAAMDVFCLPSETEGMPMTVLEAMAAALPVVASDVGGISEIVRDGQTGLLVPPHAARELEAALLRLANDPGRAREIGRAGRVRLLSDFRIDRTLAAYEELYQKAVARANN